MPQLEAQEFILLTPFSKRIENLPLLIQEQATARLSKPLKLTQVSKLLLSLSKEEAPTLETREEEEEEEEEEEPRRRNPSKKRFRGRVLVIEDNEVNQRVVKRILLNGGFEVVVAKTGKEALEQMNKKSFDLVLMDIQMPELDGFRTTLAIRDLRSDVINHEVPIIALTAHAKKGDREKCEAVGMNAYLAKPIDQEELFEAIEGILQGSGADPS